ncbi:hypothetical protein WA158_005996 [Blastocystis sp. Blastoise]
MTFHIKVLSLFSLLITVYSLQVDEYLHNISIHFDEEMEFELQGLLPNQKYNVLVSYPGSIPARFVTFLEPRDDNDNETVCDQDSRKLLDTTQLFFYTDENTIPYQINSDDHKILYNNVLHLQVHKLSPSYHNIYDHEPRVFSILLQSTVLNIPRNIYKDIILLIIEGSLSILIIMISIRYLPVFKYMV